MFQSDLTTEQHELLSMKQPELMALMPTFLVNSTLAGYVSYKGSTYFFQLDQNNTNGKVITAGPKDVKVH